MIARPDYDQIATWLDEIAEETDNLMPGFNVNMSVAVFREAAQRLRALPQIIAKDESAIND